MARPKSARSQLEQAMKQLDTAINANPVQPSVIKSLETKIEVLSKMLTVENETKRNDIEQQLADAQERLKQFDGIDPSKIQELTEQNRTLRAQLEHSRTSNQSWAADVSAAKTALANVTTLLTWLAGRANAERRLAIAVDVFIQFGRDSKPLVDVLMGNGTCESWLRLSSDKERIIDTFASNRTATNPDALALREFSRLMLAKKYDSDVVKLLQNRADEARQQQEEDDRRHESTVLERDIARNRQRRDDAMHEMIHQAEQSIGPAPVIESW